MWHLLDLCTLPLHILRWDWVQSHADESYQPLTDLVGGPSQDLDDLEDTAADGVSTQAEYESLDNWRFNQALLACSELLCS